LPRARQRRRIVRQVFPEIVDVFDLPRALDVVEYGADSGAGVAILMGTRGMAFSPCML